LGIVLLARSCAMGGEDVVGEVKGVGKETGCKKTKFVDAFGALFRKRAKSESLGFTGMCPAGDLGGAA